MTSATAVALGVVGGIAVAVPIAVYVLYRFLRATHVRHHYTTISEMPPHVKQQFRRSIASIRRSMNEMCDDFDAMMSDRGRR